MMSLFVDEHAKDPKHIENKITAAKLLMQIQIRSPENTSLFYQMRLQVA